MVKVGDKVKFLGSCHPALLGQIAEVERIYPDNSYSFVTDVPLFRGSIGYGDIDKLILNNGIWESY